MADSNEISLSVEETNALRAKLGLKPLKLDDDRKEGEAAAPGTSSLANDVLVEPVLPGEKKKTEELRRKLEAKRGKRAVERKLEQVRTLGEADEEDDSASSWVKKSRKLAKQKKLAAKREAELQEQDDAAEATATYDTADLAGLQVLHDKGDLAEGTTILTLADTGVLDDDDDRLENIELAAEDRRKTNEEKRKKGLDEYKGYDDDEFADPSSTRGAANLLKKYDNIDVITGDEKTKDRDGFTLDSAGGADLAREREAAAVREKLKANEMSLDFEVKTGGTDFYTTDEMATFKKKRKKKVKKPKKSKALTADDLEAIPASGASSDHGSRKAKRARRDDGTVATGGAVAAVAAMTGQSVDDITRGAGAAEEPGAAAAEGKPRQRTVVSLEALNEGDTDDDGEMELDLAGEPLDDAEVAAEEEMALALAKARKLKKKSNRTSGAERVAQAVQSTGTTSVTDDNEAGGGGAELAGGPIVLTSMAEFVRTVGNDLGEAAVPPTTAAAAAESGDADGDAMELSGEASTADAGWSAQGGAAAAQEEGNEEEGVATEETVGKGIMATLHVSKLRGFLDDSKRIERVAGMYHHPDREVNNAPISVEKRKSDRDRRDDRRRDPLTLEGYQPKVQLKYEDDSGRTMTDKKEIFRYLSHKFHGKTSGKGKTEKRMQKIQETELSRKMESGDTPLGLTDAMRRKMAESGSAHIVMTGGQEALKKRRKKKAA